MKILFINGSDTKGGAAIAATRLRQGLAKTFHADVTASVAYKYSNDPSVLACRTKSESLIENFLDRITNRVGLQYQYFPFSTSAILKHARDFKPEVINLHNTHGGYFETRLIEPLSTFAPIVWTLHDMWSFTGNAAHTFGDDSWKSLKHPSSLIGIPPAIGVNTGQALLRQKQKIYARSRLTIVTPSKWLKGLAALSPVFCGKEVHHIPNGVDLDVYRPDRRNEIRKSLGIADDEQVLIFSADFLQGNIWKGGADLITVLRMINDGLQHMVHVIIIGAGALPELNLLNKFKVHATGYITDEKQMAGLLAAADILLYPTRADNLPNVLVESIACGTPAVTFDVGGCAEIVSDQYNGYVCKPGDYQGMASAILRLVADRDTLKVLSTNARQSALEFFSYKTMLNSYYSLFESVIHQNNSIQGE